MKRVVPYLKAFCAWLIGSIVPVTMGLVVGFYQGHRLGRLEMQCAFISVFENLNHEPAPGTLTIGCEKRGAK